MHRFILSACGFTIVLLCAVACASLHDSATLRDLNAVRFALDDGADVNGRDAVGNTPLHIADKPAVMRLLIERGADVNAKNNRGETPLHVADQLAVMRFLLERGARVDARDFSDRTALHRAAWVGNVAAARLLLAWRASVNARDAQSKTPLDVAYEAIRMRRLSTTDPVRQVVALLKSKGGTGTTMDASGNGSKFNDTVILKDGIRITGVKVAVTKDSIVITYPDATTIVKSKRAIKKVMRGP